jgi:hypothetical protein
MCTPTQLDHDLFRILVYHNDTSEILLETTSDGFRLPVLSVPAQRREAEEITGAIRTSWNLESYGLFRLPAAVPDHPFVHDYVVESSEADADGPLGMEWLSIRALSVEAFHTPSDFAAIQNSLRTLDQYRRNELPGPFGKPGWLHTVTEWVDRQAAVVGLHLTGPIRQLNASPTFSLIRFETNGPAVWFKAVGEPNLHEFRITLLLAKYFPAHTPHVLATREDCNGWLAVEAEGTHLDEHSDLEVWTRVATTLADLQIASFGRTLHLLGGGCRDARICSLFGVVEPFFEAMAELMERQSRESPPPLSRSQILALQTQLLGTLAEAADSEIPNTIGHLDFNPSNIVANRDRCVFLDWAEACAGHPFLTFQYLLQHLRRLRREAAPWESAVTCAYLDSWRSFVSPQEITQTLRVLPLLAVFAYAACADAWRDPVRRHHPDAARHFRSLTRRMKHEADLLVANQTGGRVSCLR